MGPTYLGSLVKWAQATIMHNKPITVRMASAKGVKKLSMLTVNNLEFVSSFPSFAIVWNMMKTSFYSQ